jgi:hypothetical protein
VGRLPVDSSGRVCCGAWVAHCRGGRSRWSGERSSQPELGQDAGGRASYPSRAGLDDEDGSGRTRRTADARTRRPALAGEADGEEWDGRVVGEEEERDGRVCVVSGLVGW